MSTRSVAFLASMVTLAVGSPGGSPYCRLSGLPYGLQRGIPSPRGGFTSRSRLRPTGRLRNIDRMCIRVTFRLSVSSRLTRGRLAWPRKPWVFGGDVCTSLVVTHAYIFFSGRSRKPRDFPSAPTGMLPYHDMRSMPSSASATVLMPDHHPRGSARPVSCYALFE